MDRRKWCGLEKDFLQFYECNVIPMCILRAKLLVGNSGGKERLLGILNMVGLGRWVYMTAGYLNTHTQNTSVNSTRFPGLRFSLHARRSVLRQDE